MHKVLKKNLIIVIRCVQLDSLKYFHEINHIKKFVNMENE